MPTFRFVFGAMSNARLMKHAPDPPASWTFQWQGASVSVRDLVDTPDNVPRHLGLQILVEIDNDDLNDDLLVGARGLAETVACLLSTSARAPIDDVMFYVAYETTPNPEGRALLQWLDASEVPAPRTPVDVQLVSEIWNALLVAAKSQRLVQRTFLSMSLYRRAVRETEVLFRFDYLWRALEAINPRLCDVYELTDREGLAGAKRHLREITGEDTTFSIAVGARNDLVHANRVLPDDVRARVKPLLADLDGAIIDGLRRVLGISVELAFPASSTWPHPNRLVVRARIVPDAAGWSWDRHPFIELKTKLSRREAEQATSIQFDLQAKYEFQNFQRLIRGSYEVRGADSPHPLRFEERS